MPLNIATYHYPAGDPSQQLPRSIPAEQGPFADVLRHRRLGRMTGLLSDQMRCDACPRRRGDKASPQGMARELRRLQADLSDMPFDQRRDSLARKTIR